MPNIVVIGGSAGSTHALQAILGALPPDFPAPVLIVTHIGARESLLPGVLGRHAALPVRHAVQGELLAPGQVLVAPPDLHLTISAAGERMYAQLSRGPKENHARPAIDPLFRTAATACGAGAVAVLLSGFLDDGTVGLQAIKARGGFALVQDPADADAPDMPASALAHVDVDAVLRADAIGAALQQLAARTPPPPPGADAEAGLPAWIAIENRMFAGDTDIADMERLGAQVPSTCPECRGPLWEIGTHPPRYRCLTGHAFTGRVLDCLQHEAVDEAVWAAIRALYDQEQLFVRLQQAASRNRNAAPADEYRRKAEQAREHAQLLRDLLVTSARIAPP